MKSSALTAAIILTIWVSLDASATAGEKTLGWDTAFNSNYFWRGVTYTNKFVIQTGLYLTTPLGPASFTAGSWANIEPGRYNNPSNDISQAAGISSFDLTEFDCWGEISIPAGTVTLTAGVIGYIFPNDSLKVMAAIDAGQYAGFTKADDSLEIYGKVALGEPLSPSFAVWHDIHKIRGTYFEGSISQDIGAGVTQITLGALAGFSAGQGCEPDDFDICRASSSWNFHAEGLTHLDLSASADIPAGPLTITPNIHGIITADPMTRITRPAPTSPTGVDRTDFKVVLGAAIHWSKALGEKKK